MAHTLIRTSDRSKREVGDGTEFVTETYQYDERDRLTQITAVGVPSVGAAPEVKERYYAALARQPSRYAPRVMLSFAGLLLSAALAPLGWIGLSDRRRRRQVRHTSVALLLCVCMGVDPQQVYAMNDEAIRAHAMIVAGIGALGTSVTTFAYDDNGNQIQKTVGSTTTEYTFDAENRLIAFGPQGQSVTAQYTYDADGVRNSKTVSGPTTTDYLTDKNRPYAQVIEEIDTTTPQTPVLLMRYLYGDDLIAQTNDPDGADVTSFFHYDGQMSTRQLTDNNGSSSAVTDHYKYDAFGQQLLATPGPTANKYLYTGEQYDNDLGQYYLRARYYDHANGRFASIDPLDGILFDPASLHRYLYGNSDPIANRDPSGLFSITELNFSQAIQSVLTKIRTGVSFQKINRVVDTLDLILFLRDLADLFSNNALIKEHFRQFKNAVFGFGNDKSRDINTLRNMTDDHFFRIIRHIVLHIGTIGSTIRKNHSRFLRAALAQPSSSQIIIGLPSLPGSFKGASKLGVTLRAGRFKVRLAISPTGGSLFSIAVRHRRKVRRCFKSHSSG